MRKHRHEPGTAQVEEPMLRSIRKPSRSEFYEDSAARIGKGLTAHQSAEYDIVEEVFACEVHDGQVSACLQHRAHRSEGALEGWLVVIEHSSPHLRPAPDVAQANPLQPHPPPPPPFP